MKLLPSPGHRRAEELYIVLCVVYLRAHMSVHSFVLSRRIPGRFRHCVHSRGEIYVLSALEPNQLPIKWRSDWLFVGTVPS
jgi:hypothetical protein